MSIFYEIEFAKLIIRYPIFAHVQDVEEYISYIVPFFSYHSRWSEIKEEDFVKADYDPEEYRRGFEASKEIYFGAAWEEEIVVPIYEDTEEIDMDIIVEDSLEYFNKIQAFCEENSLELILIKTPTVSAWSEIEHNTVENLAQQNNLTFLDFNEYSLMQEINYDHILDESDGLHMNYYGAKKLSAWLGDYLLENGYASDVRSNEKYAFMEAQLDEYHNELSEYGTVNVVVDPADYISLAMQNENYTIFIMARDEASEALTEDQRIRFGNRGLEGLEGLSYRASYLAVIDGGRVTYENTADECLEYEGILQSKSVYTLKSAGFVSGDVAECIIDGTSYAVNERGLNIVIYDNESEKVLDSVVFDTYASRESEVPVMYEFFEMLDTQEEMITSESFIKYIQYIDSWNDAKEENVNLN